MPGVGGEGVVPPVVVMADSVDAGVCGVLYVSTIVGAVVTSVVDSMEEG